MPNAPLLQRLCGTVPAGLQIKSSGSTMSVVFRTDSSVSNGGFTADYTSEEDAGEGESVLAQCELLGVHTPGSEICILYDVVHVTFVHVHFSSSADEKG